MWCFGLVVLGDQKEILTRFVIPAEAGINEKNSRVGSLGGGLPQSQKCQSDQNIEQYGKADEVGNHWLNLLCSDGKVKESNHKYCEDSAHHKDKKSDCKGTNESTKKPLQERKIRFHFCFFQSLLYGTRLLAFLSICIVWKMSKREIKD